MELKQPRIRSPGKSPGRLKEAKRLKILQGQGLAGCLRSCLQTQTTSTSLRPSAVLAKTRRFKFFPSFPWKRSEIPGCLGALKALALPEFSRARLARSVSVFKSANTDSCKIFKTQQNGTQPTQIQESWEASWEAKRG